MLKLINNFIIVYIYKFKGDSATSATSANADVALYGGEKCTRLQQNSRCTSYSACKLQKQAFQTVSAIVHMCIYTHVLHLHYFRPAKTFKQEDSATFCT